MLIRHSLSTHSRRSLQVILEVELVTKGRITFDSTLLTQSKFKLYAYAIPWRLSTIFVTLQLFHLASKYNFIEISAYKTNFSASNISDFFGLFYFPWNHIKFTIFLKIHNYTPARFTVSPDRLVTSMEHHICLHTFWVYNVSTTTGRNYNV